MLRTRACKDMCEDNTEIKPNIKYGYIFVMLLGFSLHYIRYGYLSGDVRASLRDKVASE